MRWGIHMSIVHTHLTHKHTEPIPEPPPAEPALIFQKKKTPQKNTLGNLCER